MMLIAGNKRLREECTHDGYRVEYFAIKDPHDLELEWCGLQGRADCSYFQSWGWVGTWLEQIAAGFNPWVLKVWCRDRLVGLGVFVPRCITRHGIIRSNALFLNEYPFDDRNMVIEYNGLLCDRDHQQAVYAAALGYLCGSDNGYDEYFFSALSEGELLALQNAGPGQLSGGSRLRRREASPTWSVDLGRFEQGVDAYLATLSKNRRAQIRRSIRLYEDQAPLQLKEAGDWEEALAYFDELGRLHTEHWRSKGLSGSFANPVWKAFHRSLIQSRYTTGEIQLLRVSNSVGPIGYLYSFTWRQRVYVLQTGFKLSEDKRLMPGYVAHVLAIVHNKQKGMKVYDLMHGDELYKRMLCNQTQTLYWLVIQRKRLKFILEDVAVNRVRSWRGAGRDQQI